MISQKTYDELMQKSYGYDVETQKNSEWNMICSLYDRNYRNAPISDAEVRIPKIIHQIWLGSDFPKPYRTLSDTWRENHPDWDYHLWTDQDVRKLYMHNRELYNGTVNVGMKSDILRYEILRQFGGLYIDTDFQCLKPFDDLSYLKFYTGISYDRGLQLYNGLIATVPNHPIIAWANNHLPNIAYKGYRAGHIMDLTGPNYFTNCFKAMVDKNSNGIVAFPPDFFYPLPNNKRDENPEPYITEDSYAVHHWAISWQFNLKRNGLHTG